MGAAKAPPWRNTNRRTAPLPLRRGGKAYAELAAHESVRAHLKWDQRCFGEVLRVDVGAVRISPKLDMKGETWVETSHTARGAPSRNRP